MLSRLRPRSVYDVMAAITFFIVVAGGSAYAAATIGSGNIKNDAVLSRHIKDGEVKSVDLAANSVRTGKVFNNTLTGADINEASLGTVPSAASVGGVVESNFNFTQPIHTDTPVDVFNRNGLRITMHCGVQGIAEATVAPATLGTDLVATVARTSDNTVVISSSRYTDPNTAPDEITIGGHTLDTTQGEVSAGNATHLTTLEFTIPNGGPGPGCELYGHMRVSSL